MANPEVRVMVVEDSKEYQEVVLLTLSLEPYIKVVHIADSGEDALEALAQVSPELVLLDYQLPGINGLEAAKQMKKLRPNVKIALVTAYADEIKEQALNEGNVDEIIPKSGFSLARVQQLLA